MIEEDKKQESPVPPDPSSDEEPVRMEDLLKEEEDHEDDSIRRGEIVEGEVIQVSKEFVFLNLNAKIDGKIPLIEFPSKPALGTKVECAVVNLNRETGDLLLSIQECKKIKAWKSIREAMEGDGIIEGVAGDVRGEVRMVDVGFPVPVKTFEFSNRTDDPATVKGKTLKFKVLKAIEKKNILILSRKAYLYDLREAQRKVLMENLQVGRRVKGVVKDVKDYGAFVDLGGMDGLVRRADLSWSREARPEDIVKRGDEIEVVILSIEDVKPEESVAEPVKTGPESGDAASARKHRGPPRDTKRISLGYKQLQPNPWDDVAGKYRPGMTVRGRVARVFDFGVFIELEQGIDGFAGKGDISWSPHLRSPKKFMKAGETVDARVISVNLAERKIGLSLRELLPDPWTDVKKRYQVGQKVAGEIVKVLDRGAIVRLDDDFDGFIHVDDISWEKKMVRVGDHFKAGDAVEAVILDIQPQERRIKLGVKQFEANPWEVFRSRHGENAVIKGRIKEVTPNGLVVELDAGREGFIHVRDIEKEKSERLGDHFKVGDEIDAAVIEVKVDERRIRLSQKKYGEVLERREVEKFIKTEGTGETQSLGDFITWKKKGG
jgi:small subunit ribosomal protein S1